MFETLKNFVGNALKNEASSVVDPALAVLSAKLDALAFGLILLFGAMAFFSKSGKRYLYWTIVFYIFAKVIVSVI